jgi:molecular chaperone DnaK
MVQARGHAYTLPEISAFILRRLRDYATMQTGAPITRAVITVPAHFNELQRAATKIAGRIAGLEVLRVINEPTAAALAYGLSRGERKRVAVYDFGGGTFDCTVLDLSDTVYEVLSTCGDSFLGGDDIDTALALRMREHLLRTTRFDAGEPAAFDRLRSAAEDLKLQLTHTEQARVAIPELGFGALGRPIHFEYALSRAEFNALATPFVERTMQKTQEALSLAGVSASSIDHVVLVGGSTRSPLVQARVGQLFGRAPLQSINVDEVVALGAAQQAASLSDFGKRQALPEPPPIFDAAKPSVFPAPPSAYALNTTLAIGPGAGSGLTGGRGSQPPIHAHAHAPSQPPAVMFAQQQTQLNPLASTLPILVDVTPHALVVETAGGFSDVLVPRNARIPCGRTRRFSLSHDGQTSVRIRVAQGGSAKFNENTFLGEVLLSGLRAAARGEVVLSVSFELDEGGLLKVSARDMATQHEANATLRLIGFAGSIEGMQQRLDQTALTGRASVPPQQH